MRRTAPQVPSLPVMTTEIFDADFIKADKRLYMTATPRISGDSAKIKEEQGDVALYSMDHEKHYGKVLHTINFSEAVGRDLLCDYKVIVLTVGSNHVSTRFLSLLADENNNLKVDDAAKIIDCWKALNKQGVEEDVGADTSPMKRAVAFCQVIEPNTSKTAKTHMISSKQISGMFQEVRDRTKPLLNSDFSRWAKTLHKHRLKIGLINAQK